MKILSVSGVGILLLVLGTSFIFFASTFAEPTKLGAEISPLQSQEIDPLFALFAENDPMGKAFFLALSK